MSLSRFPTLFVALACAAQGFAQQGVLGYYRTPAIHGDTIVFAAEGDLWRVPISGGLAQRLTTHPSSETDPAISPDGKWLAFSAAYEGPTEVYVMPVEGGMPERCTYLGSNSQVVDWTADGRVLFATSRFSTLPEYQLCTVDPKTHDQALLPLAEASDGIYGPDGRLYFTRFAFQGSQTKRYQGGTAQNIWRWDGGDSEAKPLTIEFKGTSKDAMFWNGRIFFESDRDGVMNIWSMDTDGHDLREQTHHKDFDVQGAKMDTGRIVYQCGADLWLLDVQAGKDAAVQVRLASDFDQMREKWVKDPIAWTSSANLSPDGTRVALTARGQVFVAPVKSGRLIELTRNKNVRYRDARFLPDGKSIAALSDESGEVELWKLGAKGDGHDTKEQLTSDGKILRWGTLPSPDGKWIAHTDKNRRLYVFDSAAKTNKLVADSDMDDLTQLTWSPDSRYLAFMQQAANTFDQIQVYDTQTGQVHAVTTDRFNNQFPAFSPDGKFLYYISDRHLVTSVSAAWGTRQPEPQYTNVDQIYLMPLQRGTRSPFQPDDELNTAKQEAPKKGDAAAKEKPQPIEFEGIVDRQQKLPIPPGNYTGLTVCGNHLYFISTSAGEPRSLVTAPIRNQNVKMSPVLAGVSTYDTTPDGQKILARTGRSILVFDANGMPADPAESRVNLDGWTFSFDPKEEWIQMFEEAWRLHRDYLYDPNMQGTDWPAMRRKYRPLVDRITDRSDLSDILAQMVGEISLLHTFVTPGDERPGTDNVEVSSLGAVWRKDPSAGGYLLTRVYQTDPDDTDARGPLSQPGIDVREGDVIATIDGVGTLSVPDAAALLRGQTGKQVRLEVYPNGQKASSRDVIVQPVSRGGDTELRYDDWEYSRRQMVERMGASQLGYVHLRAMGGGDFDQFARDFYPVFDRAGLIVDVRHNSGGNIDSWILEKLMRKMWMLFTPRKGRPDWNMQYAFRGPIVVLVDENTASDGEAFAEGFRRLGLGKTVGTRTWGGEVWLTASNSLVDRGIATAAEFGVYGPESKWLIEGHGFDPDFVVDNLPHATFKGNDAQLAAAVKLLQDEIAKHPNPVPAKPAYPDKSFPKRGGG